MELANGIEVKEITNLHVIKSALDLKPGMEAYVAELKTESLAIKFLELGVLVNSRIKFLRKAPFGGACYVRINDTCLALRQTEMSKIIIREA